MTPQDAAEILKSYNDWRRWDGEDGTAGLEMPEPKLIGEAIDTVVAHILESKNND